MTSASMAFNKDRTSAFKIAYEQFGTHLSNLAEQTIRLLDKARELNWSTDTRAQPVVASLDETPRQSAAVLHQRGEELSHADSCKRCQEHKGVWQSCVVAPVYKNGALFLSACSNCIYNKRPNECSLRKRFEKSGGKAWDSSLTESVIQSGGLRAVVQQEAAQKELEQLRRELKRDREELHRQREQLERLQQENERQRPERENRLEALRPNNRQPDLAVVVPSSSPYRVTKSSSRVKIDRTMGWSNKLLTSFSLEDVGAARRQMEAFVQLLVAREAGLRQQQMTLTELRNRGSPLSSWDSLSGLDASFGSTSSEGDISWTRRLS